MGHSCVTLPKELAQFDFKLLGKFCGERIFIWMVLKMDGYEKVYSSVELIAHNTAAFYILTIGATQAGSLLQLRILFKL